MVNPLGGRRSEEQGGSSTRPQCAGRRHGRQSGRRGRSRGGRALPSGARISVPERSSWRSLFPYRGARLNKASPRPVPRHTRAAGGSGQGCSPGCGVRRDSATPTASPVTGATAPTTQGTASGGTTASQPVVSGGAPAGTSACADSRWADKNLSRRITLVNVCACEGACSRRASVGPGLPRNGPSTQPYAPSRGRRRGLAICS